MTQVQAIAVIFSGLFAALVFTLYYFTKDSKGDE